MKKEIFNEEVAAQIAGALLGAQAVQLKSEAPYFVWASGWHSPIYCDNRKLQSYLEERELIADSLCSLIEQEYPEAEAIISVATGAIPWGTLAGWLLDIPTAYIRSDKKDHGLQNRIEGALKPGIKVVIVEDLISTGGLLRSLPFRLFAKPDLRFSEWRRCLPMVFRSREMRLRRPDVSSTRCPIMKHWWPRRLKPITFRQISWTFWLNGAKLRRIGINDFFCFL